MASTPKSTKKSTQKTDTGIADLQQAIVTGLEDVKAVDIQVFDTEGQTSLFERVMIASGNSNRQTRALAMSVLDQVKEAGFPKPRVEGLENGEWIIVDCGMAVCHIMQPMIRSYYHLEDIWGEKAVVLKKPARKKPVAEGAAAKKSPAKKAVPAKKTAAKKVASKTLASSADAAAAPAAKKAAAKKTAAKKTPAKKVAAKTAATKTPVAKTAVSKTAAAKKPAAKKTAAKKSPE